MKRHAHATGHAGTEPQPNNCASEVCCITRMPIAAIGPRMLRVAKSIVRLPTLSLTNSLKLIIRKYNSLAALCNEDANGNVPLGKSCNRYWQCQGGYPRLQRCPAMLVFDRRSLRCVVPPTEDCDIPTTPTPIDGDQNENNQQGQLV